MIQQLIQSRRHHFGSRFQEYERMDTHESTY